MSEERKPGFAARQAVRCFTRKAKARRKADEQFLMVSYWLSKVPDEDMDWYVKTTDKIQKEQDEKLEEFTKKRTGR